MKKITSLLLIAVTLFLILTSFIGCDIFNGEDFEDNRPDIENTATGIKISPKRLNDDTEYINIYRREYLGEKDGKPSYGPVYNIGLLYPSEFDKNNASYMYEDLYVVAGKSYEYRARYYDSFEEDYYTSPWTEAFTTLCGKSFDSDLIFSAGQAFLAFEESPYPNIKLCNSNTITNFDTLKAEGFSLALALSTDVETQIFKLEDQFISGDVSLNLLTFLPVDFYKKGEEFKDITVVGLVGQKIETNKVENDQGIEIEKNKRIYWTLPVAISVVQGSQPCTSFKVETHSGENGFDFSIPTDGDSAE